MRNPRSTRFLVVRIVALGDVAIASTVVRRIRAEHRDAHVSWLTGLSAEPLVRLFDGVDDVIAVDERKLFRGSTVERIAALWGVWTALAFRRFDTVLMLHPDPRYLALLLSVRSGRVLRARHPWQRGGGAGGGGIISLSRFLGDEFAQLMDGAEMRGPIVKRYEMADVRHRLPPTAERARGDRRRVVLAPGGARNVLRETALRRWPVESYRVVAEALLRAGHEVVLIGDAGDLAAGQRFADLEVTNQIAKLSLSETLSVLRDADVLVTHDTGPLHFARLVRTPVVALFGPTDPRHIVGEDDSVVTLWGGEHLACRPCYDGKNLAICSDNVCVKSVRVTQVLDAVDRRLRSGRGRGAGVEYHERGASDVLQTGKPGI